MTQIQEVCKFLDQFAPTRLAEDWDNVGLLTGDPLGSVDRIMTCLTVTPESAAEAIQRKAQMIVSHHPLPFRPLKRLTTETTPSRLVWELARSNVAIYSPHTGFDSALEGINQSLAQKIGLQKITPLVPLPDDPEQLGSGRIGIPDQPLNLNKLATQLKLEFNKQTLSAIGDLTQPVTRVAVACGSGGSFLDQAVRSGCDTFITGEATFHTCLEAKAAGVGMLLLGHYDSERFAVEMLADRLADSFADAEVWASVQESDPVQTV